MQSFYLVLLFLMSSILGEKLMSQEKIFEEMVDLSLMNSFIKFDSYMYRHYIKNPVRNYSVVLLLTSLSKQRGCVFCKNAFDEVSLLATSWKKSPTYDHSVFFVYCDFDSRGKEIFKKLNVEAAPTMFIFPKDSQKPFELPKHHLTSLARVEKIISQSCRIKIDMIPSYSPLTVITCIFVATFIIHTLYIYKHIFSAFSEKFAKLFPLAFITLMVSGHMWNTMHQMYLMGFRDLSFISSRRKHQYLLETLITFFLIAGCSSSLVLLDKISTFKTTKTKKKVVGFAGVCFFLCFFMVYVNNARKKTYYPKGFIF